MSYQIYPPLSDYIKKDLFPEVIGSFNDTLDNILDCIYVKELRKHRNPLSNALTVHFSIRIHKKIGFEVIGTGIEILLNPDYDELAGVYFTDLEGHLTFEWKLKKFLHNFKVGAFDFSASSLYNIIHKIFDLNDYKIVDLSTYEFCSYGDLQDYLDKINEYYGISGTSDELNYSFTNDRKDDINNLIYLIKANSYFISNSIDLSKLTTDLFLFDLDNEKFVNNIDKLILSIEDKPIEVKIKEFLLPNIKFSTSLFPCILFPRKYLIPVKPDGTIETDPNVKVILNLAETEFYFSNNKFGIDTEVEVSFDPSYPKAVIAGTSFTIGFTGLKLDLSRTSNIAEAIADGRPDDFIGCYVKEATIGFPTNWGHNPAGSTGTVKAKNLLIGTGGISGTLSLEANDGITTAPIVAVNFGNFSVSLDKFSITFHQNAIVSSTIKGTLKIPGFKDSSNHDAIIKIDICIGTHGDFSITASEDTGIDALVIPNVLKIRLKSLSFGQKNNRFYTSISGFVDIIASGTGDLNIEGLPKNIEVKKLLIWEDGKLEIEGGALTLPKALAIKIGPVKLSLSAIHLGAQEISGRKYNYFGFDGGVSVKPGGVDVQGSGIKFFYTTDDASHNNVSIKFLRIESIKIDIRIPGDAKEDKDTALLLSGSLGMKNGEPVEGGGNPTKEYIGSVLFKANKLSVAGSVGMRLNPDIPAFLIDAEIDFGDNGILLGNTGLGLYGLRGLVGQKYGLDKAEDEDYWQLYKKPTEGINVWKFKQKDGFALGVGATLATYADKGKAFSTKVFLMLGLPDVFLIQGQAAIMAEKRIQLGDTNDPPYSALISINKEAFRATLGANIKKPESGKVLRLEGKLDMAFFFNNPSGWYINLGKDSPDSERIKARIYDLFDAYAYLMINGKGIKLGAGASIDQKKGFGPVSVELGASLDIKGQINFKPFQLGGSIDLAGYARANLFKFKTSIVVGAGLAADVAHPFAISGYLYIHAKTPRPLKDINVEMEFSWVYDKTKASDFLPLVDATNGKMPAKAVNMLTEQQFKLNFNNSGTSSIPSPNSSSWDDFDDYIIPLDSFIDIGLEYSVLDSTESDTDGAVKIIGQVTGSDNLVMVPPQKGLLDQVKHSLEIKKLKIKYWDPSSSTWKPYDPYDSVPNIKLIPEVISKINGTSNYLQTLPVASWQLNEPGKNSKIRVLAKDPLSHFSKASKGLHTLEYMGYTEGIITCEQKRKKGFELEWMGENGITYQTETIYGKNGFNTTSKSIIAPVENRTPTDSEYTTALRIDGGNTIAIQLPEPCNTVKPNIEADSTASVTISYFELVTNNTNSPSGLPVAEYNLVKTDTINAADLDDYDGYADDTVKISYLEICINASSMAGSTGTGGVLSSNTGNLWIGGDGNFSSGNCQAVTLDNLVIFYDHPLVAGPSPNTIKYPYPQISTANPVVTYELDNNANDSSSNGFNGSYAGMSNPRPAPGYDGVINTSLTFCHSAIEVQHDNLLNLNGNKFLIGLWFNSGFTCNIPNKTFIIMEKKSPGGAVYRLSGSYDNGSFTESLLFEMKEGYGSTNNILQLKHSGPTKAVDGTNIKFVDNNWHYITVYCDKASKKLELYIDGHLMNTKNYSKFDTLNTAFASTDSAWVYSIEAENEETYRFNQTIPSQTQLNEQNTKMKDAMNASVQPIWRPDTTFAIQLEMKDTVMDGANQISATSQYYNFGFRTKGSVGHFHTFRQEYIDLAAQKREDEFALATFKPYINYDRSYPNADGNLLNAKPLFYESPKLSLFFTEPYVYNMFGNWELGTIADVETSMKLMVNDPENLLENANALEGQWVQKNNMTAIGEDVRILENLVLNNTKCTNVLLASNLRINYSAEYEIPYLKPQKLYTAVYSTLLGSNSAQVLNHSFNTSRYANFEEQIASFILYNENSIVKKALFNLNIALSSGEVTTAIQTLTTPQNNSDTLKLAYTDVFERLMSGVLKLSDLESPTTTEVNVVMNDTSSKILGFLIRNPEPFIDPKIKISELNSNNQPLATQCVQTNPASTITNFLNLYRKDKSSIFVSNSNMDMPLGNYTITFKNLGWDGEQYAAIGDAETITFTL